MAEPTPQEMNKFVATIDEFMLKLAKLNSPQMRQTAYASGDQVLIDDYEITLGRAKGLAATIETTTGAWTAAKSAYSAVTDQTSILIGDAIDEIRSWFGAGPKADLSGQNLSGQNLSRCNLGALGLVQLPAAAWIAGILAAAYIAIRSMDAIFIRLDASRLQREDPTISRDQAISRARTASAIGSFFSFQAAPLLIGGALALWLVWNAIK